MRCAVVRRRASRSEVGQPRLAQRRLDAAELEVEAEVLAVEVAELDVAADPAGELVVVGEDEAALAGRDDLALVGREARHIAVRRQVAAAELGAVRVGEIEHQLHAERAGRVAQPIDRRRVAPHRHVDHGAGPRRGHPREIVEIEAEVVGVGVAEHRGRAERHDRVHGAQRAGRRQHDLVAGADAGAVQRGDQRGTAGRHRDGVAGAEHPRELGFVLGDDIAAAGDRTLEGGADRGGIAGRTLEALVRNRQFRGRRGWSGLHGSFEVLGWS